MSRYIHYGHTKFDKSIFTKIKNSDFLTKPTGGLWASNVNAERGWKDWCESENFRKCKEEHSFSFSLSDNAKVLYINYIDDLKYLPKVESKFGISTWILLDFEKLEKVYDAIEVNISNDYNLYYALYGWDCDSILIMNPDVIV